MKIGNIDENYLELILLANSQETIILKVAEGYPWRAQEIATRRPDLAIEIAKIINQKDDKLALIIVKDLSDSILEILGLKPNDPNFTFTMKSCEHFFQQYMITS